MTVGKKIAAGYALPLAVLVAVGVVAHLNTNNLVTTAGQIHRTHQVLQSLEQTYARLADAQSGIRGYVITGDKDFLRPYNDASTRVEEEINEVQKLTEDDRVQQQRVASLREQARA